MTYDAIILGAGGAGLMAAATAGQLGARVLLLDHADKPGKKVLISGGGRCNFTNLGSTPECFLSENPHFMKSALSRYTQWDFIDLVDRHGIAWHEKTLGQLFCDGSARQIVAMLLEECRKGGVDLRLGTDIGEIGHSDGLFHVAGAKAPALVIATGGPSIPKMGATGMAYDIARQFGLNVVTPRPALVPFTLGKDEILFTQLSGVSCPVVARVNDVSFEEAALFTHKGLSGPAILQISSYWRPGDPVCLNILPDACINVAHRLRAQNDPWFPQRIQLLVCCQTLPGNRRIVGGGEVFQAGFDDARTLVVSASGCGERKCQSAGGDRQMRVQSHEIIVHSGARRVNRNAR